MKIAWKSSFFLQKEYAMTQTKPASVEHGEQLALFSFHPLPDRVGEFQASQSDQYWLIYTLTEEKNVGESGLRNVQGLGKQAQGFLDRNAFTFMECEPFVCLNEKASIGSYV